MPKQPKSTKKKSTSFASVYPHHVAKAERKGRTKAEVDEIVFWLTGYGPDDLERILEDETDFETFFDAAPAPNPARTLIKGVVCGRPRRGGGGADHAPDPLSRQAGRRTGQGQVDGQYLPQCVSVAERPAGQAFGRMARRLSDDPLGDARHPRPFWAAPRRCA